MAWTTWSHSRVNSMSCNLNSKPSTMLKMRYLLLMRAFVSEGRMEVMITIILLSFKMRKMNTLAMDKFSSV